MNRKETMKLVEDVLEQRRRERKEEAETFGAIVIIFALGMACGWFVASLSALML